MLKQLTFSLYEQIVLDSRYRLMVLDRGKTYKSKEIKDDPQILLDTHHLSIPKETLDGLEVPKLFTLIYMQMINPLHVGGIFVSGRRKVAELFQIGYPPKLFALWHHRLLNQNGVWDEEFEPFHLRAVMMTLAGTRLEEPAHSSALHSPFWD
jgi:hypothetical protein